MSTTRPTLLSDLSLTELRRLLREAERLAGRQSATARVLRREIARRMAAGGPPR